MLEKRLNSLCDGVSPQSFNHGSTASHQTLSFPLLGFLNE